MNSISEIKEQILPVKKGAPYIFVSYSSDDEAVVLPDVLELQKRGWNIWVDIHNVDKKKNTWTENAVKAIDNFYCKLVLFYASQTSLISENCYKELSHIDDDQTIENHINKAIPFIAIETEEIKDIEWYQNKIENNLNKSSYPPERINKHAKILGNFLKNYFTTSNEKIRVHSKDTYDSSDRYYQEIEEGILKDSDEFYDIKNLSPEDIKQLSSQRTYHQSQQLNLDISNSTSDTLLGENKDILSNTNQEERKHILIELLDRLKISTFEFKQLKELDKEQKETQKWYKKFYLLLLNRLFLYRKQMAILFSLLVLVACSVGIFGIYISSIQASVAYDVGQMLGRFSTYFLVLLTAFVLFLRKAYYTLIFQYKFLNKAVKLDLSILTIALVLCFIFLALHYYRPLGLTFYSF